jgi:hypothetical protein
MTNYLQIQFYMTGIKKLRKSELTRRTTIKVRRLTNMTLNEMKLRISLTNRLPLTNVLHC